MNELIGLFFDIIKVIFVLVRSFIMVLLSFVFFYSAYTTRNPEHLALGLVLSSLSTINIELDNLKNNKSS